MTSDHFPYHAIDEGDQETHSVQIETILYHDDVIKWKTFPRYWPFVRGIHRSVVNPPHKGQWRGALILSLIYVWINSWVNNSKDQSMTFWIQLLSSLDCVYLMTRVCTSRFTQVRCSHRVPYYIDKLPGPLVSSSCGDRLKFTFLSVRTDSTEAYYWFDHYWKLFTFGINEVLIHIFYSLNPTPVS